MGFAALSGSYCPIFLPDLRVSVVKFSTVFRGSLTMRQ